MSDHVQHNVMLNYLNSLPERERNVILAEAQKTMNMCFVPSPGPQTMAYKSKADLLLYGGQAAGGKGHVKTQPILTPFGWRALGDLRIGSAICATDGTVQRVIGIHPRGRQQLYKLTWSDGAETICDGDHLWVGWWSNACKKISNIKTSGEAASQKWVTADIYSQFNSDRDNRKRLNRFGIPVISAPCAFNVHGENKGPKKHISRTIPPYVLGVLLGDGCLTKQSIEFCSADIEISDRVEILLKQRFGDDAYITRRQQQENGFRIYGIPKKLCYYHLDDLGVMGHSAETKFIPRIYLLASVDERWELLRGLMDTDGWADLDGDIYYCTISEKLADDVTYLVRSLGGIVTRRQKIPTYKDAHGKKKSGKLAYTLRIKLPKADEAFFLQRKKEKCAGKKNMSMAIWLENIEKCGEDETICITVSHRNSLYITKDFIVTHNTALVTGLALTAHNRSLIMRPQYTELADIIDKTLKFHKTRDGFNGSSPPSLKTKDGRFIQFGACANPGDEYAWQGQGHDLKCVGKDTPVLMADGTSKPIQEIVIGDMVQTMSGPKKVTRILPKRYDDAVEININGIKQVQSVTHEILTTSGWASSAFLASACEPKLFDSAYKYAKLNAQKFLLGVRHRISRNYYLAQKTKQFQLFADRLSSLANAFSYVLSYLGIYSVLSYGVRQVRELFPLCSLFAKGPASFAHQYLSCTYRRLVLRDAAYVRSLSSLANCLASYPFLFRFYGERTLRRLGLLTSEVSALLYPHQLPDAVDTSPNSSGYVGIDLGDTHKHTHHTRKYLHPYKMETHLSDKHLFQGSYKITPIGPKWLYDITVDEVNHFITHNAIVNKNCFDEVVNFREDQVRFIMTWNRTDIPGQRVRSIFASNPPINASGDWIIGMFRPWLDITHHNPAQDGELRWFITDKNGKDVEVDSSDPVPDGYNSDGTVRYRIPKSRTFIRASIDDNPYISADYKATLDAMKEPFRSAMRDGNFMLARKDTDNQCIPTDWIREAQSRWTPEIPKGVPMCAIGVDPAAGGPDETILAPRYDGYFPSLISVAGTDTPYPQDVAALTIRYRKGDAVPVIDCGGGYGGGIVRHLEDNGIKCVAHKGAEKSSKRSADRLYAFANKRAEVYWRFREALDPSQPGGSPIILPQDQKLMSDLCSVCYSITPRGIQLESKDDVKKRLGRSPDRGDAVVMAWSYGTSMANMKGGTFGGVKKIPQAVLGHMNKRRK